MNCPLQREETQDLLLEYSAGRLDAAQAAMLEQHTENCAACSAFLVEQAAVWSALDAWEPMPVKMDFNRPMRAVSMSFRSTLESSTLARKWQRYRSR